ncbi:TRAP transporter small permease [Vannielia litorea]|uniref:TRAP transporter small permease n=1 Tax=Vannielia litorea TaxID=1217970 RepID=UPI001BCE2184|nr:TRAP transporter small permease [Vannielia litorea]MBS8229171.1 TRAP transporter small permease [Vannielia litorea]
MSSYTGEGSKLGRIVNTFEETFIAVLLGLMTLVTFANVVLRYGFNDSLIWGQEVVLILFAWLVLFGIAYAFKITAHLGVDALTALLPKKGQRVLALLSAAACLIYAFLLMKGAWDYWAPFAGLSPTEGRWFPTGIDWGARNNSFYVTDQVPMLEWLRWLEPLTLNKGFEESQWEHYDKLPRFIPYVMLPVAVALMLFRIVQATLRIIAGKQDSLIVSHEAEDEVAAVAATHGEEQK